MEKQKLTLKEKLLAYALVLGFGSALFFNGGQVYSTISNLIKNRQEQVSNMPKQRTIKLNNKEYSGEKIEGPFDYSRYIFVHPPMDIDNIYMPSKSMEIYSSNLSNHSDLFFLDSYKRYRDDESEHFVNDATAQEFYQRQDTLMMLIENFKNQEILDKQ